MGTDSTQQIQKTEVLFVHDFSWICVNCVCVLFSLHKLISCVEYCNKTK